MTDLYRLLPEEMEQLVLDMGYPRYRADQILLPLYYQFPKSFDDIPQLPKKLREDLIKSGYTIGSAKETHRIVSDDGDTTKLLLQLTETSVETVLMQYSSSKIGGHPRSTICVPARRVGRYRRRPRAPVRGAAWRARRQRDVARGHRSGAWFGPHGSWSHPDIAEPERPLYPKLAPKSLVAGSVTPRSRFPRPAFPCGTARGSPGTSRRTPRGPASAADRLDRGCRARRRWPARRAGSRARARRTRRRRWG